jgi:hypothetical protein
VAASGAWLRDRATLTRYAHVPLAGLGRDALMSIADVLMARRLREAKHVLWAADPALPDLGEHQPMSSTPGKVGCDVSGPSKPSNSSLAVIGSQPC